MNKNIHQNQKILSYGTDIKDADIFVILLHGRGASAESMLPLAETLQVKGTHIAIPQAALNRWYPNTAFGPLEANELDLSSALNVIDSLIKQAKESGIPTNRVAIGGFSQGACLASEFVARNPVSYSGLFLFSGARIGPPNMKRSFTGKLDNMPVFIGGSDVDPWVNHQLMQETADLFKEMGANVDFRTYPGMAHTINEDELDAVQKMFLSAVNKSNSK